MTTRGARRWLAGAAALLVAVAMVAGCARTVSGSAQPVLNASTAGTSADPSTGETGTSTDETGTSTDETGTSTDETGTSTGGTGSSDQTSIETSTETSTTDTAGADPRLYPTEPATLPTHPRTDTAAALLESRRLGAFVVDPSAVVPAFSQGTSPTLPLKNAGGLSSLLPSPVPEVADRAGMYAGFTVSRSAPEGSGALIIAALVFPDAAVAKKAATDLADASKSDGSGKLAVPGLPAAVGWTAKSDKDYYSHAFLANGPLVLYAFTEDVAAKKSGLPAILGKALGAQIAAVAKYRPTPKERLAELPVDPEGVYARALPAKDEVLVTDGYFTAPSMLHLMSDYVSDGKVFATAGVDVVGAGRSTVYRARDAVGAASVRDAYLVEIHNRNPKMTAYQLPDADGVRCLQDALNASYYCAGAIGRYAFEYRPDSESDLTRSLASQIAMLEA